MAVRHCDRLSFWGVYSGCNCHKHAVNDDETLPTASRNNIYFEYPFIEGTWKYYHSIMNYDLTKTMIRQTFCLGSTNSTLLIKLHIVKRDQKWNIWPSQGDDR